MRVNPPIQVDAIRNTGTLLVNLIGCFAIGFLAVLAEEKFLLGPTARVFLMIGFCGAFTTFSSFSLESANLISSGNYAAALANVLFSVVPGVALVFLGMMAAARVLG